MNSAEEKRNCRAVKRALSIALYESTSKWTSRKSATKRIIEYEARVPEHFLNMVIPVLLKFISTDSVIDCIKKAQKIALARRVRDWRWWTVTSLLVSVPCFKISIYVFFAVALMLLFSVAIVFFSRNVVLEIWRERSAEKESDAIAIEEMIEMCKKGRLRICIEKLFIR